MQSTKISVIAGIPGFIPAYSTTARILKSSRKKMKETFAFGPQQLNAFEKIKDFLISEPILKLYSHKKDTDASSYSHVT